MKVIFLLIAICVLMISCGTEKKIMDSWILDTKHNLVLSWGPPARIVTDGSDGEIYIYEWQYYVSNVLKYKHKMFYINSGGVIYSWRTAFGPVPAQRLDVNLYFK